MTAAHEHRLNATLRQVVNYATYLEGECAKLGNAAAVDPRNVTLTKARALVSSTVLISKPRKKAAKKSPEYESYIHQAAPGAQAEKFSARPMTVYGVTIKPNWAWSDGYRATVRRSMARVRTDPIAMESSYIAWYAAKNDLGHGEARARINATQGASL